MQKLMDGRYCQHIVTWQIVQVEAMGSGQSFNTGSRLNMQPQPQAPGVSSDMALLTRLAVSRWAGTP